MPSQRSTGPKVKRGMGMVLARPPERMLKVL